MKIDRQNLSKVLRLTAEQAFSGDFPGMRVLSKKYLLASEVVHEHDFFELVLVRGGTGVHVSEHKERTLSAGDVFLIRPGELHCYRDLHRLDIVNLLYLPDLLPLPLSRLREMPGYALFFEVAEPNAGALGLISGLHLSPSEREKAEKLLAEMQREEERKECGYPFAMVALFIELTVLLSRFCGRISDVRGNGDFISRILQKELPPNCRVEDLARSSGMSIRTLERLFRKNLGCPPAAYLTELRLIRGAELLNGTDLSIAGIAQQTGFSDTGYFIRLFRKKYRITPKEFRRQHRS